MIDTHEDDFPEYERPNKSQMKREVQALLDLAKALEKLPESLWQSLALSRDMLEELLLLKNMPQHGAKKRQLKRVAKLLREENVDVAQRAVESIKSEDRESSMAFHKIEQWRDKLIVGDRGVLTSFLQQYPMANAQSINQLVRNAKQEEKQGKALKSSKLLFKLIREQLAN